MVSNLVDRTKEHIAELRAEIGNAPVVDVALLEYVVGQYEATIMELVEFCVHPGTSPIKPSLVQGRIEDMMFRLNSIASTMAPVITRIRETAGEIGRGILNKLFSLVSNIVRDCISELTKVTRASGVDIGIQGFSIAVGIGGFLTFGINFAPTI